PVRSPKKIRARKSPNLFLGVDGGGTKTQAILIDSDGATLGEGFAGASNPLRVGVETAVEQIYEAATAACDAAGRRRGDIVAATFGLAGVRRADLRERIKERMSELLRIKTVEVVTDAEIALFGTTLGKAGVVLIAGTGSI
ncbi:BadF/BadG/BcrA/BcrD ATPase family protein, partial [Clavibacter michiganensis]|uniref:BadF/BadG/BcrA/BcrD ATPase family protein n=1 Tax=Clavibacter michiganensis TaxID=28447 RepID=UPI00292CD1B7